MKIFRLFQTWQNVTFQHTRFTCHIQKGGESVEQYILCALFVSYWQPSSSTKVKTISDVGLWGTLDCAYSSLAPWTQVAAHADMYLLCACPVLIQFLPIPFSHDTFTSAESQECGSEAPAMVVQQEWEGMRHFYYTLNSLLDGPCSCLWYVSSLQSLLNSFSIFLEGIVIRMYCLLFWMN